MRLPRFWRMTRLLWPRSTAWPRKSSVRATMSVVTQPSRSSGMPHRSLTDHVSLPLHTSTGLGKHQGLQDQLKSCSSPSRSKGTKILGDSLSPGCNLQWHLDKEDPPHLFVSHPWKNKGGITRSTQIPTKHIRHIPLTLPFLQPLNTKQLK